MDQSSGSKWISGSKWSSEWIKVSGAVDQTGSNWIKGVKGGGDKKGVVKTEGATCKGGGEGKRRDHSEKASIHQIRDKTCVSFLGLTSHDFT